MFTGIIEETGLIEKVQSVAEAIQVTISATLCAQDLKVGDSLAVNGCCLTVAQISGSRRRKIRFDLLGETWERTNLQFAELGSLVNLERALMIGSRLGGHFVTGHIDGLGKVTKWERRGADHLLEISASPRIMRLIVLKGSVAVDGISLTVAAVWRSRFRVWIIPHTYNSTALQQRKVGYSVNVETDLLGKYVERFVGGDEGNLVAK